MNRKIVMYKDWIEPIRLLSNEQAGQLLRAIFSYHEDGTIPILDNVTLMAFSIMKIRFDQDIKKSRSGENHWNWKGGITQENRADRNCSQYKDFREAVLKRDGFTCQICGQVGGILNVHHIKPFSKYKDLRFDPSNGITLCENCHREVHRNER